MTFLVPAVDRRIYIIEGTGTFNISALVNHALFHTCNGGKKLQGRTWRSCLLGGLIKEWAGLIQCQFGIVLCIHIVGQSVIVISWIRYQGYHISVLHIHNHCGSRTRHKGKLCRFDFQIIDLIDHKIIGTCSSGRQILIRSVLLIQNTLLIQGQTDLLTGNGIIQKHILIQQLGKSRICTQIINDICSQCLIDLIRIQIFSFRRKATDVDPALTCGIGQIILQADALICSPCLVSSIGSIDGITGNDSKGIPKKVIADIGKVFLGLCILVLIGRRVGAIQLRAYCIKNALLLLLKFGI